jgi:signal transduction histidine kinase
MKQRPARLSQRYLAALRKHLQPGAEQDLHPALKLGRQAVVLGLETLELARIHQRALAMLELTKGKNSSTRRAEIFFNAANTAIEATHGAARQSRVCLNQLEQMLDERTQELAASNRQLQRGVVRRKCLEAAAEKSGKDHGRCLEESLRLQQHLRDLTHRVLVAQENERHKISHELQDEIAQTLLGINARLLALKQAAGVNPMWLKNEIASTRRLVLQSAKSVRQFARELKTQKPA